jgi:GH24 family phage-related lysozyme (muramidase)
MTQTRRVSARGRALVVNEEKMVAKPYLDVTGNLTIGAGHLVTQEEKDTGQLIIAAPYKDGLPLPVLDLLLSNDLSGVEDAINHGVTVPLNQNQFDALADLIFNIGVTAFKNSTLLKLLNQGHYTSVPEQLRRWTFSKGIKITALVNRREHEITLWNTPT